MPDIKEYIERGVLIARLKASPLFQNFGEDGRFILAGVVELLEILPAADVVEVVHAQLDDNGRCTNCGKQANVQSIGFGHCVGSHRINYEHTKICSECGAKMDGVTDNNVGGKIDSSDQRPDWQQSMLRTFGGDADV